MRTLVYFPFLSCVSGFPCATGFPSARCQGRCVLRSVRQELFLTGTTNGWEDVLRRQCGAIMQLQGNRPAAVAQAWAAAASAASVKLSQKERCFKRLTEHSVDARRVGSLRCVSCRAVTHPPRRVVSALPMHIQCGTGCSCTGSSALDACSKITVRLLFKAQG